MKSITGDKATNNNQTIQQRLLTKLPLLKAGEAAPDFSLPDQTGKIHTFSDQKGKWVVLYFYPEDDTPGCTKEACSFRDSHEQFRQKDIRVFGVSKDPVASHKKFANKFSLPFPLLSDTEKTVINAYGTWGEKFFMGKYYDGTHRITYLIDKNGIIAKVYTNINTETHAQEILEDVVHFDA